MVSIQYPSLNYLADSRSGDRSFETAFGLARDFKDERAGKKAFDAYLASMGQGGQPMSLASLAAPQQQVAGAPVASDPASQRVASAHAASGGIPPQGAIEAYIRSAAQKRGIDPDIAVRVAMSEGGVDDPTRQSDVVKNGVREQSYGPFQLYMGGGLGNEFQQQTGLHPSDPSAWMKGIDFALDKAKESGWGAWYGAAKAGIGDRDGLGGAQGAVNALAEGSGPQMAQAAPQGTGGGLLPPPDVMRALFSSRQTRDFAISIAQEARKAQRGDPEAALKLRKLKAEIDQLENPNSKPNIINAGDGQLYNANTGQWISSPGAANAPADFDDTSSLRKEIHQLPSYKNYSQAVPIYKSMVETAGRDSKASDLNLVYGLGKIMDPTSVVREGEMVMVNNTSSLPDWLNGAINSVNGGAKLTPATRQAILTEAYGRMKGYDDQFKQDTAQYSGIVERNRMNMDDVIPNFGDIKPWSPPKGPRQPVVIDGYTIEEVP